MIEKEKNNGLWNSSLDILKEWACNMGIPILSEELARIQK